MGKKEKRRGKERGKKNVKVMRAEVSKREQR
jgi:hypothetical protein